MEERDVRHWLRNVLHLQNLLSGFPQGPAAPLPAGIEVSSHLLLLCLFLPPYHFQLWSVPLSGRHFRKLQGYF